MTRPRVSIICCWLGASDVVASARSINGLLAKQIELEVVLIDSSSDGKLVDLFETDRICVKHVTCPKSSIYNAFNKGVAESSGDWFLFLHEGDQFAKNLNFDELLGDMSRLSVEDTVLCFDYAIEREKGKFAVRKNKHFRPLLGIMPVHVGVLCSRRLWGRLNGFDERFIVSGDFDFMVRCYKLGATFTYSKAVLGFMETGGVSRRRKWTALKEDADIFRRNFGSWSIYAVVLKKFRFLAWYLLSAWQPQLTPPNN